MMKKLIFVSALMLSVFTINAQDVTGTWSGRLKTPNGDLTVVFHLNEADGAYSGTLDSPNQNTYGIELTSVTYKDSELVIKMVNLGAEYKGKLKNKEEIEGKFTQVGQVYDLLLKKKE